MRVLEIGTSAGLNLNWHRYRYVGRDPQRSWGPPQSPVRLDLPAGFAGSNSLQLPVQSIGCDQTPLDVANTGDRRWLRSCVWADQLDRLRVLDAALEMASRHPPVVEKADAVAWLEHQLAQSQPGTATVVIQTIVQQYLSDRQRSALTAVLDAAGQQSTKQAPLAWLRMEPPLSRTTARQGATGLAEVRLRQWPQGTDRLLAYAGYHGRPIRLLPDDGDTG